MSWKTWFWDRQSTKLAGAGVFRSSPNRGYVSQTKTSRLASGYGSGRSSTWLNTLKIVVLTPIPTPIASTATMANPGFFRKVRNANRMSSMASARYTRCAISA